MQALQNRIFVANTGRQIIIWVLVYPLNLWCKMLLLCLPVLEGLKTMTLTFRFLECQECPSGLFSSTVSTFASSFGCTPSHITTSESESEAHVRSMSSILS